MKHGNVLAHLADIHEHWQPHIIASLNNQHVKLAKIQGEFDWHKHVTEDEMFYVVRGCMTIEFRDKTVTLNEGDYCVVPKNVEHRPIAEFETWIMLFEPDTTVNTGDVTTEKTVLNLRKL